MTSASNKKSSGNVWRWPLVINTIVLIGVIGALVGDDWFDIVSWLCLGSSITLIVYAYYLGE